MRLTRVFVESALEAQGRVRLTGDAANHVRRVLRLRVGDELTVFDGRRGEYAARIADMARGGVDIDVGERRPVERESPLDVTLIQGIARGERMDLIVQKATELGVTRIEPVSCERSVVRLDAEQAQKRHAHWRAVAVSACEQCGRNRIPALAPVQDYARAVERVGSERTKLLLAAAADRPLAARLRAAPVTLLVGPEGGFSEVEIELARRAGFEPASVGPRILRTETAALAALAVIQAVAGDFAP